MDPIGSSAVPCSSSSSHSGPPSETTTKTDGVGSAGVADVESRRPRRRLVPSGSLKGRLSALKAPSLTGIAMIACTRAQKKGQAADFSFASAEGLGDSFAVEKFRMHAIKAWEKAEIANNKAAAGWSDAIAVWGDVKDAAEQHMSSSEEKGKTMKVLSESASQLSQIEAKLAATSERGQIIKEKLQELCKPTEFFEGSEGKVSEISDGEI